MAPGRDLVFADDTVVRETQRYLRACIALAQDVGAPAVCGPFYASTGRLWRMDASERAEAYGQLRRNLAPLAAEAEAAGVVLGIEPLNRYETSLLNTTAQALERLNRCWAGASDSPLTPTIWGSWNAPRPQRSGLPEAPWSTSRCAGNDRGSPGGDQTDWPGIFAALDDVGYSGPLNIESFTSSNASIATAASIWRPLAPSQDQLAQDGLAFLRSAATAP
jgi:D-psicose/D-tagatose/L-ribulose 3-epimerase